MLPTQADSQTNVGNGSAAYCPGWCEMHTNASISLALFCAFGVRRHYSEAYQQQIFDKHGNTFLWQPGDK